MFALEHDPPGLAKGFAHYIHLIPGSQPPCQKPYRVPIGLESQVKETINRLLDQHIIYPSNFPYASPLVVVIKKDRKTVRLALDFRKINTIPPSTN